MPRYDNKRRALAEFAKREGIPMDRAWFELSPAQHELLLRGKAKGFLGIVRHLESLEPKKYKQYIRVFLRQYQTAQTCATCHGTKLQPDALNVKVATKSIADISGLPIDLLRAWLDTLTLTQCTFSGNSATLDGGAIFNALGLALTHCTQIGRAHV